MILIKNHKLFNLIIEFIRYCVVGGTAFLADYIVLFILVEIAGIHYLISSLFGFIVGIIINYILSVKWVFKPSKTPGFQSLFIFIIIGIMGLGITEIGMWIGVGIFYCNYMLIKAIVAFVVLFWNYIARKILVFREVNYAKL